MGVIKRLSCSCGYETDLFTGSGINGTNLNIIANIFPDEAEKIKQGMEEQHKISFSMDNVIGLCSKCRKIESISRLSYNIENEATHFSYDSKCYNCGGDISIVSESKLLCPDCGQKPVLQTIGHWD